MGTITATASARTPSSDAVAAATRDARGRLGGATPTYGLLFAAPNVDLKAALAAARSAAGGAEIVGCTTAGEITEQGLTHGGAAIMLVAGEATIQVAFATGIKVAPSQVAAKLMEGLAETKKAAALREHRHITSVLLTDGLTGTAERVVEAMYDVRVQSASQTIGGAAADESAFKATQVGTPGIVGTDSAAVLHVFGAKPWGVGIGHGLQPTTKQMRVTKAHDNIVIEINGEPAFSVYERHGAERGIKLTREDAPRYRSKTSSAFTSSKK